MLFLLLLSSERIPMPPSLSCPLLHFQELVLSSGGSWCSQCPTWPFPLLGHCLLPSSLSNLTVQAVGKGSRAAHSLTVSPALPSLPPPPLYLSYWVGLWVSSSVHLCPAQSIPPTQFSLLWVCPEFASMKFLVRYPGSSNLTHLVTCVVLLLGSYPLWASVCDW